MFGSLTVWGLAVQMWKVFRECQDYKPGVIEILTSIVVLNSDLVKICPCRTYKMFRYSAPPVYSFLNSVSKVYGIL